MEEGWTWLSIDCLIFLYYSSAVHFQHTDRVGQSLKHRISGHLGYWFLLIFAYQQSGSLQLRLARTARTKLRKVGMIGSGWARSHKSKIYKFFLRTTPQNARSNNPADLTTTGSSWIKTDRATKTLQTSEFVFICFWDWSTILAAGCGIRTHSVAHHSNDSVLKAAKKFQFDYEILRKKHLQHELRNQSDGIHWRRRCLRLHPVSLGWLQGCSVWNPPLPENEAFKECIVMFRCSALVAMARCVAKHWSNAKWIVGLHRATPTSTITLSHAQIVGRPNTDLGGFTDWATAKRWTKIHKAMTHSSSVWQTIGPSAAAGPSIPQQPKKT